MYLQTLKSPVLTNLDQDCQFFAWDDFGKQGFRGNLYSYLPNTSPGWDNSQGWEKVENQGLNSSQGWEEEKTKGRIIDKGGKKRKPRAE